MLKEAMMVFFSETQRVLLQEATVNAWVYLIAISFQDWIFK